MTLAAIQGAAEEASLRQPLSDRFAAVHRGLEVVDYALRELAFLDPVDPPPYWAAAQRHTARARSALARAPSIRWPLTSPPPVLALAAVEVTTVIDVLIDLADVLVLALVEAAEQARRPDDETCCLQAALYVNDLHEALHKTRNSPLRTPTD